ncbi:MAG: hypothetical protein ACRETN_10250 [Nevskiales bacterium]
MSQQGSAVLTVLRLLAGCCVVVVGVIAAQIIMQRFGLGVDEMPAATPALPVLVEASSAPVLDPELPLETAPPDPAPVDETGYRLQATFVSNPPTASRALLRGPDGQSKWYVTGQQPESGLLVKEVQKDRVVFEHRGEEKVQRLKRDARENDAATPPTRGADAPLPQPYAKPPAVVTPAPLESTPAAPAAAQ